MHDYSRNISICTGLFHLIISSFTLLFLLLPEVREGKLPDEGAEGDVQVRRDAGDRDPRHGRGAATAGCHAAPAGGALERLHLSVHGTLAHRIFRQLFKQRQYKQNRRGCYVTVWQPALDKKPT